MTLPADNEDLEHMAAALEASGDYKVLRRLRPRFDPIPAAHGASRQGVLLDLETTGLDAGKDEVIELAMVPFTYLLDGSIIAVGEPFHAYRQPSTPISAEITGLTGITDAMVAGQVLDLDAIADFVASAALVIAHNAGFDRRFAEKVSPAFVAKPWACSMCELPWAEEGFEGTKLGYLAAAAGFFYDRHRAVNDCLATIELLRRPLPVSGVSGLAKLLESARRSLVRIWAENTRFDLRDSLKARGYRWSGGEDARPKAWWRDVPPAGLDAELGYLRAEIYGYEADILATDVTALDRYSVRA